MGFDRTPMRMLNEPSALQLLDRARGGDRTAFDRLFSSVEGQLMGFVRSSLSPSLRQQVDPEDIRQETLLRAFRSIHQFEWQGEKSFCRWLEGIAGHVIGDDARKSMRRKELRIIRDPTGGGDSPSKQLRREERFARLKRAVEDLAPDHRTAIVLSRIEGLTIRELAKRMGRSETAAKSLLFRAMKELKRSFGDTESLGLGPRTLRESAEPEESDGP